MYGAMGFSQGFRQQGEKLDRKRRDLAQAFNEFKAANPTATFDEYQSFIDQYAGDGMGSNYLRGGAPSEDVLKGFAEQNEKVRKAQEQQQLLEGLQRRGNIDGQLQGMADETLMNMDGDDFDAAYQKFVDRLGGPEQATEQFGEDQLRSYIGPNRLRQLANEQVRQRMPDIKQYLQMADASEIDEESLGQYLGIRNPEILSPIVERAQTEATRQRNEYVRQNRMQMLDVMQNALANGQDPIAQVQAVYGDSGYNLDNENLAPLRENAQSLYEQQQEQQRLKQEREVYDAKNRVRQAIREDQNIDAMILQGDKQTVTQMMLSEAKSALPPADFEKAYGVSPENASPELFNDEYEARSERIKVARRNQYDEYRREREDATETQVEEFKTQNVDNAERMVSAMYPDNDVPAEVARTLASRYVMQNDGLEAFERAFQKHRENFDETTTIAGIVSTIENDPEFYEAVTPISQWENSARTRTQPLSMRPFDSWQREFNGDLKNIQSDLEQSMEQIRNIDDPRLAGRKVNELKTQIASIRQNIATEVKRARDEQSIWVEPGTGGFNDAEADRLQRQGLQMIERYLGRIRQLEAALREQRAASGGSDSGSDGQAAPTQSEISALNRRDGRQMPGTSNQTAVPRQPAGQSDPNPLQPGESAVGRFGDILRDEGLPSLIDTEATPRGQRENR